MTATALTVDEVVAELSALVVEAQQRLQQLEDAARHRPHDMHCGEHRHDHIHAAGYLLGLTVAVAMLTGRESHDLYAAVREASIR